MIETLVERLRSPKTGRRSNKNIVATVYDCSPMRVYAVTATVFSAGKPVYRVEYEYGTDENERVLVLLEGGRMPEEYMYESLSYTTGLRLDRERWEDGLRRGFFTLPGGPTRVVITRGKK